MTLETIYYIGQTVAVVAIIISLIFVGLQMRDANRLARAQMHQQISESFTQLVSLMSDAGDDFYEAFFSPDAYRKLGRAEMEYFNGTFLAMWKHYENVYYQHKNGFVAEEYWQSTSKFMTIMISREGMRFWWEGRKNTFTHEFVSFVESLEVPNMPVDMKMFETNQGNDIAPDEKDEPDA